MSLLYEKAADEIRDRIRRGVYPVGSKLPGYRVLAAELGVSSTTAKEALGQLRRDGILTSSVGSGTFVAAEPDDVRPPLQEQIDELRQRLEQLEASIHR